MTTPKNSVPTAEIDPQILFRFNEEFYLDSLLYNPGKVEVIDISQLQVSSPESVKDVLGDNVYAGL
jgi:hypothetical protein